MTTVAIDGPGGAGKSTVAGILAERLGLERLDTGAMYRALTLLALRHGTDPADGAGLAGLAREMELSLGDRVVLDGEDVTAEIRAGEVNEVVSLVAAHPEVRAELVERQRAWVVAHGGGVVEGRDIGSVVLPGAELKVFLTASPEERAARRAAETVSGGGAPPADVASVGQQIAARDLLDSSRSVSPLAVANGAVVIDSTGRTVDEVVEEVLKHL
ncbi:MAG TPA: (d)CMP kinase [Acidimicrobiales bacterium]|nr:(d)CMP kinase [Acidimicrobiales bacterium]